jgi:hypothetical protein
VAVATFRAQQEAALASKAAAEARKAAAEATQWASKAQASADKAADYATQAKNSADEADRSAAAQVSATTRPRPQQQPRGAHPARRLSRQLTGRGWCSSPAPAPFSPKETTLVLASVATEWLWLMAVAATAVHCSAMAVWIPLRIVRLTYPPVIVGCGMGAVAYGQSGGSTLASMLAMYAFALIGLTIGMFPTRKLFTMWAREIDRGVTRARYDYPRSLLRRVRGHHGARRIRTDAVIGRRSRCSWRSVG